MALQDVFAKYADVTRLRRRVCVAVQCISFSPTQGECSWTRDSQGSTSSEEDT